VSVKAIAWAWGINDIQIYEKVVLLFLAHLSDENGECLPSKATIAKHCGCSRRKVDKCIKHLREDGLILVINRNIQSMDISNVYKIIGHLET